MRAATSRWLAASPFAVRSPVTTTKAKGAEACSARTVASIASNSSREREITFPSLVDNHRAKAEPGFHNDGLKWWMSESTRKRTDGKGGPNRGRSVRSRPVGSSHRGLMGGWPEADGSEAGGSEAGESESESAVLSVVARSGFSAPATSPAEATPDTAVGNDSNRCATPSAIARASSRTAAGFSSRRSARVSGEPHPTRLTKKNRTRGAHRTAEPCMERRLPAQHRGSNDMGERYARGGRCGNLNRASTSEGLVCRRGTAGAARAPATVRGPGDGSVEWGQYLKPVDHNLGNLPVVVTVFLHRKGDGVVAVGRVATVCLTGNRSGILIAAPTAG